mmetsp:Transcript_27226/g.33648  ORF Transcript_27226/g.33648 Transcript_27226/m.33648 type:complete len:851 (-) Transcript_27226:58-2610(-)
MRNTNNNDDNKREQKLQAVLLADSFLTTFQPITLDKTTPKVLCPLNNVTMLAYAIEYLAGSGVEELYVFCVSGHEAIEEYVQSSTWTSTIKVVVVCENSVTDAGGALRFMYDQDMIKSNPFILMSGDVVTNAPIGPAIQEHKARNKKDSNAIMTVLLKRVGGWSVDVDVESDDDDDDNNNENDIYDGKDADASEGGVGRDNNDGDDNDGYSSTHNFHDKPNQNNKSKYQITPLRPLSEDLTVALANTTPTSADGPSSTHSRILLYETNPNSTSTKLPTSFFQTSTSIELFNDMINCGVYICSPEVLAKFYDEWDYLHIETFITNSVADEEGIQPKIYAKVLNANEYAARIYDFRTYHSVSNDLLKRWCYPIVPDNLPSGYEKKYRYGMERYMMYIEQKGKTKVGKCVTLKGPGMVGSHTKINDGCFISNTVIGNKCFIEKNVKINSSHLWEQVTVEDNVSITESILCNGCVIKKGAVIKKGCIIGRNCVIGENVILAEFTRITACAEEDDMFDSDQDDFDSIDDDDNINDDDVNDDDDTDGDGSSFGDCNSGNKNTANDIKTDYDIVGNDGIGRVWTPSNDNSDNDNDNDDDVEDKMDILETMKSQSIGYNAFPLLHRRMLRQIKDDGLKDVGETQDEDKEFILSSNLDENGFLKLGRQANVDVVKEMKDICLEFNVDSNSIGNLHIELNAYKFSQNASFSDCITGAVFAIMEKVQVKQTTKPLEFAGSFKKEIERWAELFQKFCRGIEEEISVIQAVENVVSKGGMIGDLICCDPVFGLILKTLNDEEIDVVSDEAILKWASSKREGNSDGVEKSLFHQPFTQNFIQWLEQDSDSDSDDGSSSSGSDSD